MPSPNKTGRNTGRRKFQKTNAIVSGTAEKIVGNTLDQHFANNYPQYKVTPHPNDLINIFNPVKGEKQHGVQPDLSITNTDTGKTVWLEVKYQKDKGTAHERMFRYTAPGLVGIMQKVGILKKEEHPVFWVLHGGLANLPRRRKEISISAGHLVSHILFWEDVGDYKPLVDFFETRIRPVLENK